MAFKKRNWNMPEQVFINCAPEDSQIAEEIEKRLELAGIFFYAAPVRVNPVIQKEMVEKIRDIAAGQGCMVCIISQKAVTDSLFVSNIHLMCETARNSRVLVKYQVEDLENDQSIRLFDSQAYLVKRTGRAGEDISVIIKRINQIFHPSPRDVYQILSGIISRKALTRLLTIVAVAAVAATVLFNFVHKAPPAPTLPTPTPVLLYTPFIGQSQDAGLRVAALSFPENKPATDPAVEALFAFKPAHVFMQDDFNNPAFDASYDGQKWTNNYNRLESAPGIAINQANGVLQLAVAPTGEQQGYLALSSKYMFNPQQVTYVGYRFRINEYKGVKQENSFVSGGFSYQFTDLPDIFNIQFDGFSQKLQFNNSEIELGSRWHTVEMVSQTDRHFIDIFLDGKKINSLSLDEGQFDRWMHAVFSLYVSKTNNWVSMQIDDVIFGGDDSNTPAFRPEDAPYRFTPDTVALHEDFSTPLPDQNINIGSEFVTQPGGVLSFRIPSGQDEQNIKLLFPTKPINVNNYYATRFRFTSPDDDYWAASAGFYLIVLNQNQFTKDKPINPYNLFISAIRHDYTFGGGYGISGGMPGYPFGQNRPPGSWHTLEMIIKPPDGNSQTYAVFYWVDGALLGVGHMQEDPGPILDANAPLVALIRIDSGIYRQEVFSGEIDGLVIGTIASDKIKE